MKRFFWAFMLCGLLAASGCSFMYGGITDVEWTSADGTEVSYTSGKDMQGVEVEKTCLDEFGAKLPVCTVKITVKESTGVEAIKSNNEALRELIRATKDYADMTRGLSGAP